MLPTDTNPPIIILFNHVAGDTWVGIPTIGPLQVENPDDGTMTRPGVPLDSATLEWTLEGAAAPALVISSAVGAAAPLSLVSAIQWELSVPPIGPEIFNLPAGKYLGRLKTIDSTGVVFTLHWYRLTVTGPNPPSC